MFFIAVYIPQQTDSSTKTALNELYTARSKQVEAMDLNAGKLKSI
jgi:hypothetical protein